MRFPKVIHLAIMFAFFGMALYTSESFTSLFMHQHFSSGFTFIGIVFTLSNLSGSAFQMITGRLGDRIGHKPVLVGAYTLSTLSLLGLYYTAGHIGNVYIFSLLFLLFATSLWSSFPPFSSLVSISSRDRMTGFTITRVALNVGTGIGPGAGGYLIEAYGFPIIYLVSFLSLSVSLILAISFKPGKRIQQRITEETDDKGSTRSMFRNTNRTIVLLSLSSLLLTVLLAQDTVTLPNYASVVRHLTTGQIGLVFTSNGILVVLMQYPVTMIMRRIGVSTGFLTGLTLFSLGVLSFALATDVTRFILSEAVITLGEDFLDPSGSTIISTISGSNRIGENMGIYNSFNAVGYSMGPLLGGAVISVTLNPYLIWWVVSLPGFVSVLFYLTLVRKKVNNEMRKKRISPGNHIHL